MGEVWRGDTMPLPPRVTPTLATPLRPSLVILLSAAAAALLQLLSPLQKQQQHQQLVCCIIICVCVLALTDGPWRLSWRVAYAVKVNVKTVLAAMSRQTMYTSPHSSHRPTLLNT